jgi:hypothetical protein
MSTAFFWENRNDVKVGAGGISYGESEEGDVGSSSFSSLGGKKMSTEPSSGGVTLEVVNLNDVKLDAGGGSYGEDEEGDAGSSFLVASGGKKMSTAFF